MATPPIASIAGQDQDTGAAGSTRTRSSSSLIGFDGADLRFVGTLTIERWSRADRVESFRDEATWELTYCGHARIESRIPA
jgi:hypothetical protein